MRDQLIQALNFPCWLVRADLDLSRCPHSGNYHRSAQDCRLCESQTACAWLYHNDECSGVAKKPTEDLLHALQFALEYIDTGVAQSGHSVGVCECDRCKWLKNIERLVEYSEDNILN
jgi:hypothetical protein